MRRSGAPATLGRCTEERLNAARGRSPRQAGGMAAQSAPIHIAMEIRNVLMQTSDTTSWKRSAIIASCFANVYVLFLFCFKVNGSGQSLLTNGAARWGVVKDWFPERA